MADGYRVIFEVFSFCLGAVIASFLNVVIYRVPAGLSIVKPASHCPKCKTPIKWYHNIPILAWLYLRGKCAYCKTPISPRYAIIELFGGVLFWMAARHFSLSIELPFIWIWLSLMIVGSFIDFDHKLLPDFVTVGGMILGVILGAILSLLTWHWFYLAWSLSGLVLGFGGLWLVRFIGSKAFGREAMGLGDVFLMGAVGAVSGPIGVVMALILSSLLGSAVGLTMMALSKAKFGKFVEIPYGPYICLGSLAYIFYGPEIIAWYLKILGVA